MAAAEPRPIPMPFWWFLLVLATAGGVHFTVTTLVAYLDEESRVTGPRKIVWRDARGADLERSGYDWRGCEFTASGELAMLLDGVAIWTPCAHPAQPQGGLARIEPERGVATLWSVPEHLPLEYVAGILPAAGDTFAVIYWTGEGFREHLAAGLIGPQGWTLEPRRVSEPPRAEFLAAAWVDGALEVVMSPSRLDDDDDYFKEPVVARLTDDGVQWRRPIPPATRCAGTEALCLGAELAWHRDGQWRFLIHTSSGSPTRDVVRSEDGRIEPWTQPVDAWWVRHRLDNTLHGQLDRGFYANSPDDYLGVLQPDGRVEPLRAAPRADWERFISHDFELRDGRLVAHEHWELPGSDFVLARPFGDGWLILDQPEKPGQYARELELRLLASDGHTELAAARVARFATYACEFASSATLVPRAAGGYWLVDRAGCYVALDEDLQRADPLSTFEHMWRRASTSLEPQGPDPRWRLGWLLLGLPTCFLAALVVALLRFRQVDRRAMPLLVLAAIGYFASAGRFFQEVLALLR